MTLSVTLALPLSDLSILGKQYFDLPASWVLGLNPRARQTWLLGSWVNRPFGKSPPKNSALAKLALSSKLL